MFSDTAVQPDFERQLIGFKPEVKDNLGLILKGACQGFGGPTAAPIVEAATIGGLNEGVDPNAMSEEESYINYVVPAVVIAAVLLLVGLTVFILYRTRRRTHRDIESSPERRTYLDRRPVVLENEAAGDQIDGQPARIVEKSVSPPPFGAGGAARQRIDSGEEGGDEISSRSGDENAGSSSSSHRQPLPPPVKGSSGGGRKSREAKRPVPAYRKPPPYALPSDSDK